MPFCAGRKEVLKELKERSGKRPKGGDGGGFKENILTHKVMKSLGR